jgi:surface protein
MSDNLDFGASRTIGPQGGPKLTVYGSSTTIPLNPVRFPNAYLTAPIYDLSNNITDSNAPKLNIYRSIPETRYPFTYIGTPAIQNIGYFGQINPENAPKISVYRQASNGNLVFSYNYTGTLSLVELAAAQYLPIITAGTALTIVNSNATKNATTNTVTVTVNISYIDDGSNFGLSFYNSDIDFTKTNFYNNNATDLSITTLSNIPLSRDGHQFAYLTNIPTNFFADNTVKPTILPNTSLAYCFYKCSNFDSNISLWNTSNVTNMSYMFSGGWYSPSTTPVDVPMIFNQDISAWNTSNVTNMTYMFACGNRNASFNKNLSNWDTHNVTNMSVMFAGCTAFNNDSNALITNGNKWDTSKVTQMYTMFCVCTNFNQDINNWNTSNVNTMNDMFNSCTNFNQDIGSWITSKVTTMYNMFQNATAFDKHIVNWNLSSIVNNQFYTLVGQLVFTFRCTTETSSFANNKYIPLITNDYFTMTSYTISPDLNSEKLIIDTKYTVTCNTSYNSDTANRSEFGLSFNKNTMHNNDIFNLYTSNLQITTLKNIPLSKLGFQFKNVATSSETLFAANTVPLILPNTSLDNCFAGCVYFNQSIDNWNTTNVTNMSYMFANSFILYPSYYNAYYFVNFNQNISNLDTSNVTNMSNMFDGNIYFQNGGFSLTLNARSLVNMSNMFLTKMHFDYLTNKYQYTLLSFNKQMTLNNLNVAGLIYTAWHSGAPDLTKANAPIQLQDDLYW